MQRRNAILTAALAILLLGAAALIFWPRQDAKFDGDRVVSAGLFSLRFDAMNGEDSETLTLREGDGLRVSWQIESGSADILIALPGAEPLYRADGRGKGDAADFELTAPASGEYVVSVSARKAKGWMKFERITT